MTALPSFWTSYFCCSVTDRKGARAAVLGCTACVTVCLVAIRRWCTVSCLRITNNLVIAPQLQKERTSPETNIHCSTT